MKPDEVIEFDDYVDRGSYSAWYKDNLRKIGKDATKRKTKIIREYRVEQFHQLEDILIKNNGTIEDISKEFLQQIEEVIDGKLIRIMVSNHDVYIEFSAVSMNYTFINPHIQYDEYADKYGNKLYHQHKTVNYADYIPGLWYVALKDILKVINENSRTNN